MIFIIPFDKPAVAFVQMLKVFFLLTDIGIGQKLVSLGQDAVAYLVDFFGRYFGWKKIQAFLQAGK